jgi:hypothetical protein
MIYTFKTDGLIAVLVANNTLIVFCLAELILSRNLLQGMETGRIFIFYISVTVVAIFFTLQGAFLNFGLWISEVALSFFGQ